MKTALLLTTALAGGATAARAAGLVETAIAGDSGSFLSADGLTASGRLAAVYSVVVTGPVHGARSFAGQAGVPNGSKPRKSSSPGRIEVES